MKRSVIILVFVVFASQIFAQSRYITRNGHAQIYSSTVAEDITAQNYSVTSTIEPAKGEMVFSVPVQSFEFEKSLMQRHFNQSRFMDSDTYPRITFKGTISNLQDVKWDQNGTYNVTVKGDLTIRDVTKPITEKGTIHLASANQPGKKVVKYLDPIALKKKIDLKVKNDGESMISILQGMEKYLEYAVNTGNTQFFNQLYSGHNLPAFMGEILAAATNTSMYTCEVAPVATLIENEMIGKMLGIAGFLKGDGVFLTGGSNANLIAMFSARNRKVPRIKTGGLMNEYRLAAFVSDQSHYSFETSANLLGLGSDAVYKVKTDASGRMLPSGLENSILHARSKGEVPFFVAATAATTMLGAFDPFEEIALLARKYDLWMHVDGVKLWTAWKYFGDEGYSRRMDKLLTLATYFERKVKDDPSLELMHHANRSLCVSVMCRKLQIISIGLMSHCVSISGNQDLPW